MTVDHTQLAVSPELDEPLRVCITDLVSQPYHNHVLIPLPIQVLKRNLKFLSSALSTAVDRRVWREALEKLQDMLWADVLMKHSFTTLGAAQFVRDLQAIASLVDQHIAGVSAALSTLEDGARVLSLPLEASVNDDGTGTAMSLQQASDRFFIDNMEAKKALEELGVETLTPANARNIVQKRVEYQD